MNRRQMLEPGVWLKALGPEDKYSRMAYPTADGRDVDALVGCICRDAGYLVEMVQEGEVYRVSLLPLKGKVPIGRPPVRILYSGTDLRSILAAANHELDLLAIRKYPFTISTKEHVRWVAS